MHIQDNILRHYLQNCYFINGTAYAGKSTMCKMLAERFDMIHCEENYNMDTILKVATQEEQPDFSYFNTKPSWQHYVSRSPEEFERWMYGVSEEVTGFEIAELIRLSAQGEKDHCGYQHFLRDAAQDCPAGSCGHSAFAAEHERGTVL